MGMLRANRTVVVTMSALLASCATAAPVRKDATLFSPPGQIADKSAQDADAALTDVEPSLDLDGAVRQAQAQRKMGDLVGATRTLSQLVLVAPDDARVLGEYGKTLVAQGRSDDALAFLERAIELQATDWSLFSAQGVAYDQKGKYVLAQAAYARALGLKPGEPTVLSNDALSHIQSGDLDEAERLLREAAQAGGDYPRIASNLALVQSLKASRSAAAPAPAKLAVQPAAPPPAPAPVVAPPAEAEPLPPVAIVHPPVDSTPLNAPQAPENAMGPKPQTLHAEGIFEGNPTVRMQKVPVDPFAGPVAPKKTVAAKAPAQAKAPVATEAATDKKAPAEEPSLLRPSLDSAKQANAGQ